MNPILVAKQIASSLSIDSSIVGDLKLTGVSTDSRSIQAGELFVAIKGENFDGHKFLEEATRSGAAALLVDQEGIDRKKYSIPVIQVADCIQAIRSLAKTYRETKTNVQFIAIGGSNGKTTTKEWVAHLLQAKLGKQNVFKTEKSENSILGIALSLLRLRDQSHAVIEIGIDEPGWMDRHLEVVQPNFGLITTIQEEHLEKLHTLEKVAEEELKLLAWLEKSGGGFCANQDSSFIRAAAYPNKHLTYALDSQAQIEGRFVSPRTLSAFGLELKNPLPGKHNASNLLAALAMLRMLNPELTRHELKALAKVVSEFKGEAHRSQWLELEDNQFLLDDCYNANPSSMEASFESFLGLSAGLRKVLILGDMLELGPDSVAAHKRIINLAAVNEIDCALFFGEQFSEAFKQSSNLPPNFKVFRSFDELSESIKKEMKAYSCYLLKGSRGMKLERAIDILNKR